MISMYLVAENKMEAAVFRAAFCHAGYTVLVGESIDQIVREWSNKPADLIVVALRTSDSMQATRRLRTIAIAPLVLIVDPLTEEGYVQLLNAGASFVHVRSCSACMIVAQANAILRHSNGIPFSALPVIHMQGITLDAANRTVQVEGQETRRLTNLEFRLLYTLVQHAGQLLTTEQIIERVWGYGGEGDSNLVRNLVSRLRKKLELDPAESTLIQNVQGIGYGFLVSRE